MRFWPAAFLALGWLLPLAATGQTSGCSPFTICQPGSGGGGGGAGAGACAAGEFVIETVEGSAPVCSTAGPYAGSATDGGPAASVAANSVALTTDTTGAYVASATASQGLTLTGSEAASLGLQDCAASEVLKRNVGDTAWECAAAAAGDVVGPASAVDNRVARFDLTTGKLIQSSSVGIDDSGIFSVPTGFKVFDQAGTPNQLAFMLETGTWDGQPTTYFQCGEGSNRCTLTGNSGATIAWNAQSSKFLIGPSQSPAAVSTLAILQADNKDGTASEVVLRAQGRASQTGDLFQARDSAGATLARIGADGYQTWAGQSMLAADATNATATMAATGLSVPVTTGKKYKVVAHLMLADSVAAEGAAVDFDGGNATATNFRLQCAANDAAFLSAAHVTALATDFSVATVTGDGTIRCEGSFEPSSTGTFAARFAQATHAAGTLTLYRGSSLKLEEFL